MKKPFIITSSIKKGGSGKTSTSMILISALAQKGYKVLGIDTDSQMNLTSSFGLNSLGFQAEHQDKNAFNFITKSKEADYDASKYIAETTYKNIDFVPSCKRMEDIEEWFGYIQFKRETYMKKAIENISKKEKYDFIIIDAPTILKVLNINNYQASDYILVPLECGPFEVDMLVDTYQFYINNLEENPELDLGIVMNKVDRRKNMTKWAEETARKYLGDSVYIYNTKISTDAKLGTAQKKRKQVHMSDKKARIFEESIELAEELIKLKNIPPATREELEYQVNTHEHAEEVEKVEQQ